MNYRNFLILGFILGFTGCISIPQETVILSRTMGGDLIVLHNSHRSAVELEFDRMENDINSYIDEVYAPAVLHYVLKLELDKKLVGENSLYTTIEEAGRSGDKKITDEAVNVIEQFLTAANQNIESKRRRLLDPVLLQKDEILKAVDIAYQNVINANSTVTNYLQSVNEIKEVQNEALARIGLEDSQNFITQKLLETSSVVSEALKKGREIDAKGDDAFQSIDKVISEIERLIKN